jgi:beta-lactamase class D
LELGATSETEFFLRMVNAQLTFVKRADGTVTEAVLHQGGQNYEMLKIGKP